MSLVEIRWFYLNGGGCNVNYIGVAHFFAPGRLEYQFELSKVDRSKEITVYKFILPNGLGKTRINHVIHAFIIWFLFNDLNPSTLMSYGNFETYLTTHIFLSFL